MRSVIVRITLTVGIVLLAARTNCYCSPQTVDGVGGVVDSGNEASAAGKATIRVDVRRPGLEPIPRYLTGKFCEHLGSNIYNGMDAQILRNPTFAVYPFWTGQLTPDGVTAFYSERDQIVAQLKQQASRVGWPGDQLERLTEAYDDGLACWWICVEDRESVQVSPDTGPFGQRAQRVETQGPGQGIAQWVALPLHRTRSYEFELLARSPDAINLTVSLTAQQGQQPAAQTIVPEITSYQWSSLRGRLQVDSQADPNALYRLSLTTDRAAQFVVARLQLRPADHIDGADPDVIQRLRESRLPILRWPGGNFVSSYHWRDGVGSIDERPTLPNYAWGGVETNLFGTDEFMAFCRAVGCEPMICVNAGSGTPEEAARWIEYCNGSADTPMGKLRVAHGHSDPYGVKHWEIGNELWGRWQYHWTTATGYVDRLGQFSVAMRDADPSIQLYVCGAPVMWGKQWNDVLISWSPHKTTLLNSPITDHPLIGGQVPHDTDPLDVYRDFMAVPDVLASRWAALRQQMLEADIPSPHLAVTELQMFARIRETETGTARLTHETLVNPGTLAEALYNALIYHRAIQLAPFVTLVTHSATVNHGGGLRKQRERVYANPCHYLQAAMADLAEATPVEVRVESPDEVAPRVLPDLKAATPECRFAAIDPLAAIDSQGTLWLSIVHRGSQGPIDVTVEIEGANLSSAAELRTLSADVPWAANSLEAPERVHTVDSSVEVHDGRLTLRLEPYTWVRLRIPETSK